MAVRCSILPRLFCGGQMRRSSKHKATSTVALDGIIKQSELHSADKNARIFCDLTIRRMVKFGLPSQKIRSTIPRPHGQATRHAASPTGLIYATSSPGSTPICSIQASTETFACSAVVRWAVRSYSLRSEKKAAAMVLYIRQQHTTNERNKYNVVTTTTR